MQCLTGWVIETTNALISYDNQDVASAKQFLEAAMDKYILYEEAVALGSKGKWGTWYKGEKKIDVKSLKKLNDELLNLIIS